MTQTSLSSTVPDSREPDGRATRAVIDLEAYEANVRLVRALVSPGTEVMAVVKANAYGHGVAPIATAALAAGATHLAVATVGEGAALRRAGIAAPVVLLGPIDLGEAATALRLGLEVTIGSVALLDAVAAAARRLGLPRPAALHLKIDTGMRRYGAEPDEALAVARRIANDPMLALAGCSTHFAAADAADDRSLHEQATLFDRCLERLRDDGIGPIRAHAANSAATLRSRRYDYDLVRPGVALYGLRPAPNVPLPSGMRPVMSVRSRIARLAVLAPGDAVGYGGDYVAAKPERVALVPIGYGDGYRRSLSGRAWMGIGGEPAPIRGRISMDQTIVSVADGVRAKIGDEVVVFDDDPFSGAPDAATVAQLMDSIPYEVVTGIAVRVPRHYRRTAVLEPPRRECPVPATRA